MKRAGCNLELIFMKKIDYSSINLALKPIILLFLLSCVPRLTPGHEYNYQFGDDPQWSQVFSFRMPPAPSPNASITFIAFGGNPIPLYKI